MLNLEFSKDVAETFSEDAVIVYEGHWSYLKDSKTMGTPNGGWLILKGTDIYARIPVLDHPHQIAVGVVAFVDCLKKYTYIVISWKKVSHVQS